MILQTVRLRENLNQMLLCSLLRLVQYPVAFAHVADAVDKLRVIAAQNLFQNLLHALDIPQPRFNFLKFMLCQHCAETVGPVRMELSRT